MPFPTQRRSQVINHVIRWFKPLISTTGVSKTLIVNFWVRSNTKSTPCMKNQPQQVNNFLASRAPKDGFFLNTLKTLFRLSRVLLRAVEIYFKWRYKICICSVILGQPESFRNYDLWKNYKGLSIIFPKILDAIWRITKVRHFLITLSILFLNPKIVGFLFSHKNSLTWEVSVKIKLQKIVGDLLLDKLRKLYMNGTFNEHILVVLK